MDVIEWLDTAMSPAAEFQPGLDRLRYATQLLFDVAEALRDDTPLNRTDLIMVGINRTEVVNSRLDDAGANCVDFLLPPVPPYLAPMILTQVARWTTAIALESSVQPCRADCERMDEHNWLGLNEDGVLECVDTAHCAIGAAASAEAYVVATQWIDWFELCWFDG